jgi:hypothetical protein
LGGTSKGWEGIEGEFEEIEGEKGRNYCLGFTRLVELLYKVLDA